MISNEDYFYHPKRKEPKVHQPHHEDAATDLLKKVEALEQEFLAADPSHKRDIDPDTGSEISGTHGGDGDGGFRESTTTITATPKSMHRDGHAVDKFDPENKRDTWLNQFETGNGQNSMLEKHGLYREHPDYTNGWLHLQDLPPKSKRRTYIP